MKKLIYVVIALFVLGACSETEESINNSKQAVLKVRLTDAPADYQEVLIDIQDVMINLSTENDTLGWQSLDIAYPGVYNLLDFTSGFDTLLVETEIPAGTINQIRLILGENNQVKVDGEYYDIQTPSTQTSGLKFNLNETLIEGFTYTLWIDFDAGRSIVQKGNGGFLLKPVIRAYTEAENGGIQGVIFPIEAKPYVMAISSSSDTMGTYADTTNGEYLINGLEEGSYTLKLKPTEEYLSQEIENIEVISGVVTEIDTIKFEMNFSK
ncbi:MAG: DUF4382 domain-containing protein [Bacteroidetes bacterium]|nr:DUF4382 domain-containing protein [Bacteroidota bacterium]